MHLIKLGGVTDRSNRVADEYAPYGSSATDAPSSKVHTHVKVSYSASGRSNSGRFDNFADIHEAIRRMSALPTSHDFHLDANAALKAEQILAILAMNFSVDAPKIFPQDGDALVLTWSMGDIKRLLTVAGDELDLMDIHRKSAVRCDHELEFNSPEQMQEWIMALGGVPTASTNAAGNDAA